MSNNNSSNSGNSRINDTYKDIKINSEISEMNTEASKSKINPTKLGTSEIDFSEKIVDLTDSSKVHIIKEAGKDYIDIDIERIEEGKFYRIIYHGDTYCIEKLKDGQIAFYEVVE
jgi:hypothetical protein